MFKRILAATVALAVLLTAVSVASADHSWNGYHWEKTGDTVSPTVVDKTSSNLWDSPNADVGEAVAEWADFNDFIQPTLTTAKKGDITVTEAFSPFWLGLARIFIDDNGHITKGEVKLNTRLLNSYPAAAADHVLCQEIGHVLGLGHNRDETGIDADNDPETCMNDQVLGFPAPNQHDTDQLNLIYSHTHTDAPDGGGDEGGGGGPPCDKNPTHPNCIPANGHWVTVHVFQIP
jgi:hypothetical protein